MAKIQIYTTRWCGYCVRAKALLESKGVPYEEVHVNGEPEFRVRLRDLTGGWTVPQVVIDGDAVGGYTELRALERSGRLDELLADVAA